MPAARLMRDQNDARTHGQEVRSSGAPRSRPEVHPELPVVSYFEEFRP
jgi:hypothetical protein